MTSSDILSILVINPNTTSQMTDSLKPVVKSVLGRNGSNITCDFFTAPPSDDGSPGAFPSINSPEDSKLSAGYCAAVLPTEIYDKYDCFLVACYSEHPLVGLIAREIDQRNRDAGPDTRRKRRRQHVTGIFEASVITSLGLLSRFPPSSPNAFGIVTTGHVWEEALSKAVDRMLGGTSSGVFAGVATTGLNATELHNLPEAEVKSKMSDAAASLVSRANVKVICLGCAGMVGLDEAVREGVVRVLGKEKGMDIEIVDGVASGIQWLIGAALRG
ncbi:gamma-tubulin [Marasmius tenuissimus]|uniref:Gamma-tubulin n=1 Tax=Marasmius tenuissimus TaxID=585030 RepID=A0ABR2ZU73_9AGAR